MNTRQMLQVAGVAAVLALPEASQAQPQPIGRDDDAPPPSRCDGPAYDGPALWHRQERLAQFESLGEHCLKRLMVECDAAAGRQLLDPDSAFTCSLGYEALLRRGFDGNFQALLAWWRRRAAGQGD
ncbi:hypothetical protein PE066_12665 [Ramlibacter tataouinensis]|uniref:hypothetical protein n=1 Tax=Ramlibacter tataouinensis TaxID=94132 RepID=UPI0022F3BA9A|nr:hypothetical protein [Ramlibacter tataouinensis]WBY00325.1 hypothetical protein PE066_12665 [Ramlibacter tataouinensis]